LQMPCGPLSTKAMQRTLLIFGGTMKVVKWWNMTMERWWQTRAIKSYNLSKWITLYIGERLAYGTF
jgi:hypothetical protein